MTLHRNYGLALALIATLLMTGCGIKPKNLEQPAGSEKTGFPRDYPQSENE